MHYEMLVEDLKQIEEGHVPLPNYRNVPSKGYNYMEEERSPVRHSARLALSRRTLPRLAACTLDLPEQIAILGSLALGVVSEGANTMDVDFGFGSAYEAMTNPSPGTSLLIVTSVPLLGRHLLSPGPCFHLCSTARAVELLPFVLQVLSFSAKFLDEAMKVFKARIMELALFNCLLRTIVF
ncbi:hypothetical protein Ahy_Scaffold6g107849 isoform E [Arachis hypogaea]|uniref:Uncharacterized protein n=1 Tax=Arachis hypogaea TaxID=3818 RepID=A0A444WNQ0_ARAHY|nr:hypothetical protein Ahy_Scaffold6g107849 isoform E [Arachis hypogaea]